MYLHYPLHSHSSLTHLTSPPLSLMFSHNALMRCELMHWFEMGLPVIPLSIHLSIIAIAASDRPAATAHKRKWYCVCGWAKEKNIKWCNQTNIVSVTRAPLMWWFRDCIWHVTASLISKAIPTLSEIICPQLIHTLIIFLKNSHLKKFWFDKQ